MRMNNVRNLKLFLLVLVGGLFLSCSTGVEPSPDPGILRVVLQSDPADTTIVIVNNTYGVSVVDSFGVTIFQGKAYHDSIFSTLYRTPESTRQEDLNYNIAELENGGYKKITIFESYVPPEKYQRIQFGIQANILKLLGFILVEIESPPGASKFINLESEFQVQENRITEVTVQISPFKSIQRYRDSYQFFPQMKIIGVVNY